jgi:hypothetical protein
VFGGPNSRPHAPVARRAASLIAQASDAPEGGCSEGDPSFTPDGSRVVFDRFNAETNDEALFMSITTALRCSSVSVKIKNRNYSHMEGREQLFERERHKEPVPGWHCCELACAELENAKA